MEAPGHPLDDEPGRMSTRGATVPPRHILVVDDDVDIRQLIVKMLSLHGYRVNAAEDGHAGWEALRRASYDLLITDHNMPKVTGVELVKMVRSARMTLAVVLASGSLPVELLNRDSTLQLAATLLKPFTCDELLETVEQALRMTGSGAELVGLGPAWPTQSSPANQWR
jgi:DNA-binding NtrC family response regulator